MYTEWSGVFILRRQYCFFLIFFPMFCEMFFYVKWGTVPRFLGFWKMIFKVSYKLCLFVSPSPFRGIRICLRQSACPHRLLFCTNIQLLVRPTSVRRARNKGGDHLDASPGPSRAAVLAGRWLGRAEAWARGVQGRMAARRKLLTDLGTASRCCWQLPALSGRFLK